MQAEKWYWQKTWGNFRTGASQVLMAWPGGSAQISVYVKGVPKTAKAFLSRLPIELSIVHVAWSGDMVMGAHSVPLNIRMEENRTRLVRPGDIAYDPKYDEITVTYGTAEARLPSGPNTLTVFGSIVTGLEEFAIWARARRFEGQGVLKFTDAGKGSAKRRQR